MRHFILIGRSCRSNFVLRFSSKAFVGYGYIIYTFCCQLKMITEKHELNKARQVTSLMLFQFLTSSPPGTNNVQLSVGRLASLNLVNFYKDVGFWTIWIIFTR